MKLIAVIWFFVEAGKLGSMEAGKHGSRGVGERGSMEWGSFVVWVMGVHYHRYPVHDSLLMKMWITPHFHNIFM